MPVREAGDRRGRSARGSDGLLERDEVLRAIDQVLSSAQHATGEALLLEGHAGMGKTRLYEAALDAGRAQQMRVLRAAGAELERNIAFGVARQLLSAQIAALPAARRKSVLASAPERVRALAGLATEVAAIPGDADLALSHGLFTLLATADEARATLIAIDDLHWCDALSLEFLLYLLHRLEELPFALVMTRRPGLGEEVSHELDRIATHPRVRVEKLSPLGSDAIGELTRDSLGDRADDALIQACRQATAGNPFYLRELLLALGEERLLRGDRLADRALELAPDAVTRALRVRVGRLGPAAGALARAVAILGDDVALRNAAALAGLELGAASAAADALGAVEILLAREPLRFVHPLVRHAIEEDIPASERATRHLDAARLLHAEGADAERVAAHLLRGRAQGDGWVVEQLRSAAADARNRGAPQSSVLYLARALDEPPDDATRADVLADLGSAEAAAGMPDAARHLEQASRLSKDPGRRAELALERGRALFTKGLHEQAAQAFDAGLRELPAQLTEPDDVELHDQLQTGFVSTAMLVPALQPQAIARSERLLKRAPEVPATQGQRLLLAHAALHSALEGDPAPVVRELAERAWNGGRLLEYGTSQGFGWRMVSEVFTLSGDLERAVAVSGAAVEDARRRAWPYAFATASYIRALPRLWQGSVNEALADLELALDARRYGWRQNARGAAAVCSLALIEKGELERAEAILTEDAPLEEPVDLEDAIRMFALAELRLAQSRPQEAFDTAISAGELVERTVKFYGFCPWRTCAALASLALGDGAQALTLASEAAERAIRSDVLHLRIRTLRVVGLCDPREAGIENLRAAVAVGESSPPRLETIRALVDLGSALRRANKRSAAREPLQRAADLALTGGATALYERARTELAAAGARPRRELLLSGPASLTPSERRIAELAAAGQSNREISQSLFVTPKTVEYHLRNTYRKLEIEGRRDLARALVA
jgi:DNA-binding CsgD family transcriptional regulator